MDEELFKKANYRCPVCSKKTLLLSDLEGQTFCPICKEHTILRKNSKQYKVSFNLLKDCQNRLGLLLQELKNPKEIILSIIAMRERIAKGFLYTVHVPLEELEHWISYQLFLELISRIGLDVFQKNSDNSYHLFSEAIFRGFNSVNELAAETLKAFRLVNDLKRDACLFVKDKEGVIKLVLTSLKWFSSTPRQIFDKIISVNQTINKSAGIDLIGFDTDPLSPYPPQASEISSSAKRRYLFQTTGSLLNWSIDVPVSRTEAFELVFRILMEILEEGLRGASFPLDGVMIVPKKMFEFYIKPMSELIEMWSPINKATSHKKIKNADEVLSDVVDYLCNYNFSFHAGLFPFGHDDLVIGLYSLRMFYETIKYAADYWKSQRLAAKLLRGKQYEKNIFRLITHLNCRYWFPDHKPMLNIFPEKSRKEVADVAFIHGETLEIVQCKTDLILNYSRMEKYLQKFQSDRRMAEKVIRNSNLDFSKSSLSLLIPVCLKLSEKVKIFLNPLHFFEYFATRIELRNWGGKKILDQYPILAKIAWMSTPYPIDLAPFLGLKQTLLARGFYEDTYIDVGSLRINISEDSVPPNVTDCVLIWDSLKKKVIDLLWLPPYLKYEEEYATEDFLSFSYYGHSLMFNDSDFGKRFLRIAILTGSFGYCQECFFYPLIPGFGGRAKPTIRNAIAYCPVCEFKKDLSLDGCIFPPDLQLSDEITTALNSGFPFFKT